MNTNFLFAANLTNSFELDLTSNLVKKSSSKDFNDMFESTINKFNEDSKNVKNEVTSKVNNVNNDNDLSNNKIEKNETKYDSDNMKTKSKNVEDKETNDKTSEMLNKMTDEEKEKLEEVSKEVLYNILYLLNNPNVDLSEFVEIDSEGMFEVKIDEISDLTSQLKDILSKDVLARIDDTLESSGLELEKVTTIALDFVVNEANAEMMKLEVRDMDLDEMIDMDIDIDVSKINEKEIEVFESKDLSNYIDIKDDYEKVNINEGKKEVLNKEENVNNVDVNKEDNFEILKNKINQLVDKIEIEEKTLVNENKTNKENSSKEMLTNNIESADSENVNIDLQEDSMVTQNNISNDENLEIKKEISDEHVSDSKDGKENKDVERININKVENASNVDAEMFGQNFNNFEDISSAIHIKAEKQTVTDRFLESFNVAKQMVKGVEMKVTEATSEMSIQLDPENLGKVNLKIVTENGLVMAKFEAESQRVKEIIESNLSLLKESLENKGISISGLEVSVGQDMNRRNGASSNLEYMRKIVSEKNPHKILGKTINKFNNYAEISNSQNKSNGLFMTRSKINYIA